MCVCVARQLTEEAVPAVYRYTLTSPEGGEAFVRTGRQRSSGWTQHPGVALQITSRRFVFALSPPRGGGSGGRGVPPRGGGVEVEGVGWPDVARGEAQASEGQQVSSSGIAHP